MGLVETSAEKQIETGSHVGGTTDNFPTTEKIHQSLKKNEKTKSDLDPEEIADPYEGPTRWCFGSDPSENFREAFAAHNSVFCFPPSDCQGIVHVHYSLDRVNDKQASCHLCGEITTVNIPALLIHLYGMSYIRVMRGKNTPSSK